MASKKSEPTQAVSGLAENAEAAEAMKDALKEAKTSADSLSLAFMQQLKIVNQLRDAMLQMQNLMQSVGGTSIQQGSLLSSETWDKVEKSVMNATTAQQKFKKEGDKVAKFLQSDFTKAAAVATGAITGLGQGVRNFSSLTKSIFGILGSAIGGIYRFGKALLSIPFRIMDALFEKAKGAGDTALATAIENVREQFGSLKSESSSTVIGVAKSMGRLDNTGVSAYRIFGNLAQRIEEVNKLAIGMGASFQVFQKEIAYNGEAIMRYQRGLGITDEQMASIASTALRMGTGIAEVQNEMTKQALGMSKAFGVNAKVISKDMAKAMQDLAHFGHLSTKEMAIAATFANKLGVSVDKLTGILDATKTFDQTAESVSKLNEQFNLNLDAQEYMLAENPAEQVDMLRKAFASAGHDVSKFNRFERDIIKSSTGMSDELLNSALSAKNASVSLTAMQTQGAKNEKRVMSQTEAMTSLADSIKRIVEAGQTTKGGILAHIFEGFGRGIQQSKEFQTLMINMNTILQQALQFGVKLGRMFVDLFPGVKDMLGGLSDLFDPKRYQKLFDRVLKAFDIFKTGGVDKMDKFMEEIQKAFFDFFDEGKPAGKKIIDGIGKFFDIVLRMVGRLAEWVLNKLADALKGITDFIKNPKIPDVGGPGGLGDTLLTPFMGAIRVFMDRVWPALKELAGEIWNMIKKGFEAIPEDVKTAIGATLIGIIVGPSLLGAIAGAATSGLFSAAGKGIATALSSATAQAVPQAAQSAAQTVSAAAAQSGAGGVGAAAQASNAAKATAAAVPDQASQASMQAASQTKINWAGLVTFLLGMAFVMAIGLFAFARALQIVKGYELKDIIKASIMLGAISLSMIPLAGALLIAALVGTVAKSTMGQIVVGMLALGVAAFAMAGVAYAMVSAVGKLEDGKILAVAKLLEVISTAFVKAGAVVLIAAGVGQLVISTAGIGGLAIAAGMTALGSVVAMMADTTINIMVSLSRIKEEPSALEAKARSFVAIMNGITEFTKSIGSIIHDLKLQDLNASDKEKTLKAASDFVSTVVGELKTLVNTIVAAARALPVEQVKVVESFGTVLLASAEFLSAILGITPDLFKSVKSWKESSRNDVQNFGGILWQIKEFVKNMMPALTSVIQTISTALQGIQMTSGIEKSGKIFADILQSVVGLMKVLIPSIEVFKKNVNIVENRGMTSTQNRQEGMLDVDGMTGLVAYVGGIMAALKQHLPDLMSLVVDNTLSKLSGIDPKKLEALPAIGELLKSLATIFSAISSSSKGIGNVNVTMGGEKKEGPVNALSIVNETPKFAEIIKAVGQNLPEFFTNLQKVINQLPANPKEFVEKAKLLPDVFESVSKIISAITSSADKIIDKKPGEFASANLLSALGSIKSLLWGMLYNWAPGYEGQETTRLIIAHLDELSKLVPSGLGERANVLVTVFDSVNKITKAISDNPIQAPPPGQGNDILVKLANVKDVLEKIVGGAADSDFKKIIAATTNLANTLPADDLEKSKKSMGAAKEFMTPLRDLVRDLGSLGEFPATTKSMWTSTSDGLRTILGSSKENRGYWGEVVAHAERITGDTTKAEMATIANSLKVAKAMVKQVQDLEDALGSLPVIDAKAKLEKVANSAGLGGSGTFAIRNKDVVVLVDLKVTMDAGTVEKVIIERKDSVLRDRINYLAGKPPTGPTKPLSNDTPGIITSTGVGNGRNFGGSNVD